MLSKVNKDNWTLGTTTIQQFVKDNNQKYDIIMDNLNGVLLIKYLNSIYAFNYNKGKFIDKINKIRLKILDKYFWKQIDSFDQNNILLANKIRLSVIKYLQLNKKSSSKIIGIGGEYYVYFPFLKYSEYIGISNHESIIQDADFNLFNYFIKSSYSNYTTNYNDINTFPNIDYESDIIYDVIINVITIHQNHIEWIKKFNINNLIIINCKPLYKKIPIITKYFEIKKIFYYKNINSIINIIICKKKTIEYIGLGSNCSITYHLNLFNLRKRSYPFDWAKISINQLIKVLENNFSNYTDLFMDKISNNHLSHDLKPTFILSNSYNIKFAHEITLEQDCNESIFRFTNKLEQRIERFRNLGIYPNKIIFFRIEISKINTIYFEKIDILINLLERFVNNFELVIIFNYQESIEFTNSKVKFIKFDKFDPDWKMEHLNWQNILFNI